MFIYATRMGITSLILHHLIPIFVFATYLAIVTLLHHTEMYGTDWTSLRLSFNCAF